MGGNYHETTKSTKPTTVQLNLLRKLTVFSRGLQDQHPLRQHQVPLQSRNHGVVGGLGVLPTAAVRRASASAAATAAVLDDGPYLLDHSNEEDNYDEAASTTLVTTEMKDETRQRLRHFHSLNDLTEVRDAEPTEYDPSELEDGSHADLDGFHFFEDDHSDATPSLKGHKKAVSFSSLEFREYNLIVGDHPCCTMGCPLSLGWQYEDRNALSVDYYEATRNPRRSRKDLRTSCEERKQKLLADENNGLTFADIRRAERKLHRVRSCDAKLNERVTISFFTEHEKDEDASSNGGDDDNVPPPPPSPQDMVKHSSKRRMRRSADLPPLPPTQSFFFQCEDETADATPSDVTCTTTQVSSSSI